MTNADLRLEYVIGWVSFHPNCSSLNLPISSPIFLKSKGVSIKRLSVSVYNKEKSFLFLNCYMKTLPKAVTDVAIAIEMLSIGMG